MNTIKLTQLTLLIFVLLLVSCDEGEDVTPSKKAEPITILGIWSFTESSVEVISIPEDSEVTITAPNVNELTWTFDDNNILVVNPDTTWTESYNYDSLSMELQFNDGTYDVLKLTKDSLNLRFYSELVGLDIEFYTYFQLVR